MMQAKSHSTAPRRATLWDRLVAMAENRPQARAINRLGSFSDEQLAARGLTRRGELRRILGARYWL